MGVCAEFRVSATNSGLPQQRGDHALAPEAVLAEVGISRWCGDHGDDGDDGDLLIGLPRRRGGHGSENRTNREARMKVTWSYWAGIADMGGPGARRG